MIKSQTARKVVIILLILPVSILLTGICFYLMGQLFNEVADEAYYIVTWFSFGATCFAAQQVMFNKESSHE